MQITRFMAAVTTAVMVLAAIAQVSNAADTAALAAARAMDEEIRRLKDLPDSARGAAITRIAQRIRRQPPQYAVALAGNLVIDGTPGSGCETVQQIADTLAHVLRGASPACTQGAYKQLAELARYQGVQISVDHPEFLAAMREFEAADLQRQDADFTIGDLEGKQWNLRSLRGRVVLVNFWATWCPPCRAELPDLQTIYQEFKSRGLVVLAITDEDPETVRRFAAEHKLTFPVLLDRRKETKAAFLIDGIPVTLLYDRTGRLVAQAFARPNRDRFLAMLRQAGLH